MTKEDYMRLPKERLAELLVEKENQGVAHVAHIPPILLCYEGGTCTYPFRDCVNCPKVFGNYPGTFTTNTTNTERNDNE